ncbi:acyltransferase family protein [Shimia sp.]|uniref:acyltransferase family protein n=1 Tax=Shimia sp. TaxID=1954381 RepID=UPI003BACA099
MLCNVQVLRAVAATMVVLHHLRTPLLPYAPWIKDIHVGAAGVDIFFVISGFIITLTTAQRTATPAQFFGQRATRIVPLYWLFLLLIAGMVAIGLRPVGLTDTDATLANLFKSMAFIPFERSNGALMPILGVGWTLNFEAFFYLLFGTALFLPSRHRLMAITTCLLLLPLAGLLLQPSGAVARFFTNSILLEFLAGCWLAHWYLKAGPIGGRRSTGWLLITAGGLGLALPEIFDWGPDFQQLMPLRFLVFGLPAFCIVAGALYLERASQSLKSPFWQQQGAASYALYLSHTIVLQIGEKGLAALKLDALLGPISTAAVLFVAAIAAGTATHLWIERPITRWCRDSFTPKGSQA